VPLEIPFLLFGNEVEKKICWRMYLNNIPTSEQPFRLICSLPDVKFISEICGTILRIPALPQN
jgi:hypothetical protein